MKSYAFSPADPNTIYAGYGDLACVRSGGACPQTGGVIVSHDSGQTWALAGQTLLAATIAELAVDPANAQIVYAAAATPACTKRRMAARRELSLISARWKCAAGQTPTW